MKFVFTGHRPNKLGNDYELKSPFVLEIKKRIVEIVNLYEIRDKEFVLGMALGIDQLAAQIAIEQNIAFTAAIPCLGQELKWPQRSQDRYNEILKHAWRIEQVSYAPYTDKCMQRRNQWMIDQMYAKEDILIAVWDGSSGGTKNCIDYAKAKNKTIKYIMLEDIEPIGVS